MTASEARDFAWSAAAPMTELLIFAAVVLLGFALLREITR